MEDKKVSLDTMIGIGKKKQIAGREYTILPVNICDMHYIMGLILLFIIKAMSLTQL